MNKLNTARRKQIVACLVEGKSIRATCRMTGAAKGTVLKLLADLGAVCCDYQDRFLLDLPCKRIQCDEIWSFCYRNDKRIPDSMRDQPGVGSIWTWTAICAETKLVPSFRVGNRDADCAHEFMTDLAARLTRRVQLTAEGHKPYLQAVEDAVGADIDYATLIKIYGHERPDARYSPTECIATEEGAVIGSRNPKHVSTRDVERQKLTMRVQSRRFTPLTNAVSKKAENLAHAVALHFMHYNFALVQSSLRVTPAMAGGVADHVWELEEILALLDATEETARDVARRRSDRVAAV